MRPVNLGRPALGQVKDCALFSGSPSTAPPAAAPEGKTEFLSASEIKDYLDKIDAYMAQVKVVQDYVKEHPAEAASTGLDKISLDLPASADVASYPKFAAVRDALKAFGSVKRADVGCIDALGAALKDADAKLKGIASTGTGAAAAAGDHTWLYVGIGVGAAALTGALVLLAAA
jgi:hypothetical protein